MRKIINCAIIIALLVLSVFAFNDAWDKVGALFTLVFFALPMVFFVAVVAISKKGYLGLLAMLPLLMIADKQSDALDVCVAVLLLGVMSIAAMFVLEK